MKLVKDIIDTKVVYYWNSSDRTVSPAFAQVALARDWLVSKIWSSYPGTERRRMVSDRRRDRQTSTLFSSRFDLKRAHPKGRRMTDLIETNVAIDRCLERVNQAMKVS